MTRFGSLVVIAMAAGLGVWACGGDGGPGGGNGGSAGVDASSGGAGGSGGSVAGSGGASGGGGTAGSPSGGGGSGGQPAGGTGGLDAGLDAQPVTDASSGGAADASADGSVGPSDTDAGDGGDAEAGPDPCSPLTSFAQIQSEGTVSGTGTYSSSSPENVRDNQASTSWWTAQTFGTQTFTWENDHEECIDSVNVTNTAADQTYGTAWQGWGFDEVVVRVRNQAGDVVWTVTQSLPGSPDSFPSWAVGGKLASKIELEFSGFPEAYGGFSELQIIAKQ